MQDNQLIWFYLSTVFKNKKNLLYRQLACISFNTMWQMESTGQKYKSGELFISLSWSSFSWGRIPILDPPGCNHQPFHTDRDGWKRKPRDDQSRIVHPKRFRSWRGVGVSCISSQTSSIASCSGLPLQLRSKILKILSMRQGVTNADKTNAIFVFL